MAAGLQTSDTHSKQKRILTTTCIILGMVAFFVAFILLDNAYYKFSAARFPTVGNSTGTSNIMGCCLPGSSSDIYDPPGYLAAVPFGISIWEDEAALEDVVDHAFRQLWNHCCILVVDSQFHTLQ